MSFLAWSASDDGQGQGCWEGMCSLREAGALQAARDEALALLARAENQAPGPRGPLEHGGLWDALLEEHQEADGWVTLTLTLTGPWEWGVGLVPD